MGEQGRLGGNKRHVALATAGLAELPVWLLRPLALAVSALRSHFLKCRGLQSWRGERGGHHAPRQLAGLPPAAGGTRGRDLALPVAICAYFAVVTFQFSNPSNVPCHQFCDTCAYGRCQPCRGRLRFAGGEGAEAAL
jgi:hypothetical protein